MASSSSANTPFWADKSFILVVVGLVVSLLNGKLGLNLDAGEIAAMMAAIVAFVVGNKWKSGAITVAEVKAANALEVAKLEATTPELAAKQLSTIGATTSATKPPLVPPVVKP